MVPVVVQRMQIAEGLARNLERLGLQRKPAPVPSLAEYLAQRERERAASPAEEPGGVSAVPAVPPKVTDAPQA